MANASLFGPYEKYILALLPLFGVALTTVHQIGRMALYEVPLELMQFSTVSTVISAIALTVTIGAALLSVTIVYTGELQSWWHRFLQQTLLASMVTAPFWMKDISVSSSISWPTVFFVIALAASGYMAENYYRAIKSGSDSVEDTQKRIERAMHVVLTLGILTILGSFAHGYYHAREMQKRLFVKATNDLVAGSFNGQLILKRYEPRTQSIVESSTSLLSPGDRIELEARSAPLGK